MTDGAGWFHFRGVKPGTYLVVVVPGYPPGQQIAEEVEVVRWPRGGLFASREIRIEAYGLGIYD
jgi:hypothetical protein